MPFTFVDRVPSKLGRVKITPENGGAAYYAIMERADDPSLVGTPLSAANLNAAQESLVYSTPTGTSTWKGVYLSPTGKDSNAGTEASPMATVRGAIRKYAKWHKAMDIYLADGTYTEDIGVISTDNCTLSIRSTSEDMTKVTINSAAMLESHLNQFRLYNLTLNMTAANTRVLSINAGQFVGSNVRFIMPTSSTAACINVYNGASAFLSECVINAGTASAVYGNGAFWIRAYNCTSTKTVSTAFNANYGTVIEYTPTMTATNMTKEDNGGKCIPLAARVGKVAGVYGALYGRYLTSDGLLLQWGTVTITPTATNVATSAVVTFGIKYDLAPLVYTQVVSGVPENCSIGVMRNTVSDPTAQIEIVLTRAGTTSTVINWFAIGPGNAVS